MWRGRFKGTQLSVRSFTCNSTRCCRRRFLIGEKRCFSSALVKSFGWGQRRVRAETGDRCFPIEFKRGGVEYPQAESARRRRKLMSRPVVHQCFYWPGIEICLIGEKHVSIDWIFDVTDLNLKDGERLIRITHWTCALPFHSTPRVCLEQPRYTWTMNHLLFSIWLSVTQRYFLTALLHSLRANVRAEFAATTKRSGEGCACVCVLLFSSWVAI